MLVIIAGIFNCFFVLFFLCLPRQWLQYPTKGLPSLFGKSPLISCSMQNGSGRWGGVQLAFWQVHINTQTACQWIYHDIDNAIYLCFPWQNCIPWLGVSKQARSTACYSNIILGLLPSMVICWCLELGLPEASQCMCSLLHKQQDMMQ